MIGTAESKSAGQLHIQDFFRPLGDEQRESQTRERFTDHTSKLKLMRVRQKRKKTKLAKYDATFGFHTQNVMGMPKAAASLEAWFSHFRQRQDCGALDVVLIQETHVLGEETTRMQHDYSRSWGFNDIPSIGRGSHTKPLSERPARYCREDRSSIRPLRMRCVDGVFDPAFRHL